MGLSNQQIALGRQSFAPFPTNDPDPVTGVNRTKRDFDFTNGGAGYASATAIATAMSAAFGETWTVGGTTATCDSKGFIPGTAGALYAPLNTFSPFATAGALNSWTLYFQVERAVCSLDGTYNNGATIFNDSVGALNNVTTEHVVFACNGPGSTNPNNGKIDNIWNAQPINCSVTVSGGSGTQGTAVGFPTSRVPAQFDQVYTEIVMSMVGTKYYLYIDGQLMCAAECGALMPGTWMNDFFLGAANTGGLAALGNFHIKRFQISSRGCAPQVAGPSVAFLGDSFTAFGDRGDNSNQPAGGPTSTKAQINAAQKGLFVTQYPVPQTNYPQIYDNNRWIRVLQALSQKFNGFYFPYYWAGQIGHGWGKNAAAATGWGQSANGTAFLDAVNAAQPEILVTYGSVNDVRLDAGQQTNILADAKSYLDYLVDNNPNLRTILFYEGFNWAVDPRAPVSTLGAGWTWAPYNAEWKRILGIYRAGLDGYQAGTGARATNFPGRGIPTRVAVKLIPTDSAWSSDPNWQYFTQALNPLNFTNSSSLNSAPGAWNMHPASSGHAKMTELMWPALRNALLAPPY